jgi:hypothetical protein
LTREEEVRMCPPNESIKRHIDSNSELLDKMSKLTKQLQTELFNSFETDMGIPLPTVAEAQVRQLEYTMVYSSDPVAGNLMSGAKTLLDGALLGDWPDVASKALDTVQTIVNKIVGAATIQVGGNNESMKIKSQKGDTFISAAYTEVQECAAQEWATDVNFYVSFYVFVVWTPSAHQLAAIAKKKPHLA